MTYYINEQCNALHDLVTELYESYFDDDGNISNDKERIETGLILSRIIEQCNSLLEDIKID
jgi:hypothetical protein